MTGRRAQGFTLLEVMIALAIALGAIAVLVRGMVNDVTATNHMKQMTIATELVRSKLLDIEQDLQINGWGEDPEIIKDGDFASEKFPDLHWRVDIVKIQLPTSAQIQQAAQQTAQQALNQVGAGASSSSQPSSAPSSGLLGGLLSGIPGMGTGGANGGGSGTPGLGSGADGMLGALGPAGMILGQFDIFKTAIEEAIRKVTVQVTWKELGRDQTLSATEYLVDTKPVNAQLMATGGAGGGMPGGAAAPGGAGSPAVGTNAGGSPPPK